MTMREDITPPDNTISRLHGLIRWPGDCHWGDGALKRALQSASRRLKRPLIVTDRMVWQAAGPSVQSALSSLEGAGWVLYDGVMPNPTLAQVREALEKSRSHGCDSLIAVGGGSTIDVTKVVMAGMASGLSIEELQGTHGQAWLDAAAESTDPMFVAVPTTSGTGSESSSAALIQNDDGRKRVFRSLRTRPSIVALQPDLTLSLPMRPTAQGGFDALLHALGAWVNTEPSPIGKATALQALRLGLTAFPKVLKEPGNLHARADMQMSSYLAGVAIGMCKVDAIHGMCTPLEARVHMAHAEVLAPLFGVVARYTVQTHPEQYAQAARSLQVSNIGDDLRDAQAIIARIESLAELGGIATAFADLRLDEQGAAQLATQALQSASTPLNPRPLSAAELQSLYLKLAIPGVPQ